jgi:lipopolysaccharide transport system permease protein
MRKGETGLTNLDLATTDEVVIRPKRGFHLGLRDVWTYRELAYFLMWRDVKVRYKQTAFGAAWAILQPLTLMVALTVLFQRIAKVSSAGVPYPIFAYSALLPWTLFVSALGAASDSVVTDASLITKVYFPRLILPIAAAGSYLLDFAIGIAILVGMMLIYGVGPSSRLVWLPVFTVMVVAIALAGGIWLTALNVKYRDIRYVVPFLLQVGLFATPIAYSSTQIPERWRLILGLNPMAGVVEGFRWSVVGAHAPGSTMVLSCVLTLVLLVGGVAYFRYVESTFADII